MNRSRLTMKSVSLVVVLASGVPIISRDACGEDLSRPIAGKDLVFEERDGLVAVEAEHFFEQTATGTRRWYLTAESKVPGLEPDGDPHHVAGASGGAYLEALPDTRRTHGDRLIRGENFSNEPGKMAILSYRVHFTTPGRYYVWARTHSTGTEDNGIHVGIDGAWPESGRRMQWTAKRRWFWDSKQRTAKNHGGERHKLFIDVEKAGLHTVQFSMREDGFEFDKWLMTTSRDFERPAGVGPAPRVLRGAMPAAFAVSAKAPAKREKAPRKPDGNGAVTVSGELREWHKITLTLAGPFADELDEDPNPFLDYRMTVKFTHADGGASYTVPGYFAADGNAANTSARSGTRWRAHFAPDRIGAWSWAISLVRGKNVAVELEKDGESLAPFDGVKGSFDVKRSDKSGRDFRGKGRLSYVGEHFLRFANGEYFLKAGADAPENLLAYEDFDDTPNHGKRRKHYGPHVRDWRPDDPTWKNDKGKGLIGAVNYLASEGMNVFSFLTYSHNGDDKNVFPHVDPDTRRAMDCSKLDQWEIIFEHADRMGMYLHFKMQETENDQDMDGGELGVERKLYYRELVARFGHHLALNWNIGEENTNTAEQVAAYTHFFDAVDPYAHNIVIHTYPKKKEEIYAPLLGTKRSLITGASLQSCPKNVHGDTLEWRRRSASAGRPWVVANDEQCPANTGVKPDRDDPSHDEIRKEVLWGHLMAGGAGVELYFGYKFAHSDLTLQDFRSRDLMWDQCRYALEFFERNGIPFHAMEPREDLARGEGVWCLAGESQYVLYTRDVGKSGEISLDLRGESGPFEVHWFDPKRGGPLQAGAVNTITGGGRRGVGAPPVGAEGDRVILVRAPAKE